MTRALARLTCRAVVNPLANTRLNTRLPFNLPETLLDHIQWTTYIRTIRSISMTRLYHPQTHHYGNKTAGIERRGCLFFGQQWEATSVPRRNVQRWPWCARAMISSFEGEEHDPTFGRISSGKGAGYRLRKNETVARQVGVSECSRAQSEILKDATGL